jgi:xanthine dehydrogenase YagR molybdenum-binding subunit
MAAEQLGIPLDRVDVALGDSSLPPGPVAGGSNTTASACNTVMKACQQIIARLDTPPLSERLKDAIGVGKAKGSEPVPPSSVNREQAFDRLGIEVIEEYAEWKPSGAPLDSFRAMHKGQVRMVGGEMKDRSAYAYGAEFVEVRVHKLTRESAYPALSAPSLQVAS